MVKKETQDALERKVIKEIEATKVIEATKEIKEMTVQEQLRQKLLRQQLVFPQQRRLLRLFRLLLLLQQLQVLLEGLLQPKQPILQTMRVNMLL